MWHPFSRSVRWARRSVRRAHRSFSLIWSNCKPRRVIREDSNIKGCGYFRQDPKKRFHVLGNVLRLICNLIISPLIIPVRVFGMEFVKEVILSFIGIGNFIPDFGHSSDSSDPGDSGDSGGDARGSADNGRDSADNGNVSDNGTSGDPNNSGDADNSDSDIELGPQWMPGDVAAPDAVLSNPLGEKVTTGGERPPLYDVTGFKPRWMLKVTIKKGESIKFRQISIWPNFTAHYTALSYNMDSAVRLFEEAGKERLDPRPIDREWTPRDRRRISNQYLQRYYSAQGPVGDDTRVEYVWLDEFCLADQNLWDEPAAQEQRDVEVGRLADIFRNAAQVVVFCHQEGCDHTGINCVWATRLFTLAEILYAQRVVQMTRENGQFRLFRRDAREFREAMQTKAAEENKWHLYAIYQHTVNAGMVPWQVAIHALVVEAIRRDEAGNFTEHQYLGRGLNGLLPRRARLGDLKSSGWNDLAWLLELNQAFYNPAALAAVCSIADDKSVSWLGKPIQPAAGNERLEPLVIAFPISGSSSKSDPAPDEMRQRRRRGRKRKKLTLRAKNSPPLTILDAKTLALRTTIRRDARGLYNNDEMKAIMYLTIALLVCATIAVVIFAVVKLKGTSQIVAIVVSIWAGCMLYYVLELLVGTMYLVREGWVFVAEKDCRGRGSQIELVERGRSNNRIVDSWIATQDPNLSMSKLTDWGERQLVPEWEAPGVRKDGKPRRAYSRGKLIDLKSGVCVDTIVVGRPDLIVPLAIHGSGVTCMLIRRPKHVSKHPAYIAEKVGMANFPTYILSQMEKAGTIYIGSKDATKGM